MTDQMCTAIVYVSHGRGNCQRKATIFRKMDSWGAATPTERGYCWSHDPVGKRERQEARSAKWDAEWKDKQAADKKAEAIRLAERRIINAALAVHDVGGGELGCAVRELRALLGEPS